MTSNKMIIQEGIKVEENNKKKKVSKIFLIRFKAFNKLSKIRIITFETAY